MSERAECVQLLRRWRRLELANEILLRAALRVFDDAKILHQLVRDLVTEGGPMRLAREVLTCSFQEYQAS